MVRFFLPLLIFCVRVQTRAQRPAAGAHFPSPEAFVNAVFPAVFNGSLDHYYLVSGTDSCRFLKYNYDEWVKYHLSEPVPFDVLNELAQKVYLSRYPYYWKPSLLKKAICVTRHQADSILEAKKDFIFSFSLPQFTDDGQFGVIDLNLICGPECGKGVTCIFRLTATGVWKLVGENTNWDTR
ncbi:MAG TPA: hypothetical protein VHE54_12815 [Puia sp.]|nr:hypothetical protein [Puia sp.]